jgi:hypothetical protein
VVVRDQHPPLLILIADVLINNNKNYSFYICIFSNILFSNVLNLFYFYLAIVKKNVYIYIYILH